MKATTIVILLLISLRTIEGFVVVSTIPKSHPLQPNNPSPLFAKKRRRRKNSPTAGDKALPFEAPSSAPQQPEQILDDAVEDGTMTSFSVSDTEGQTTSAQDSSTALDEVPRFGSTNKDSLKQVFESESGSFAAFDLATRKRQKDAQAQVKPRQKIRRDDKKALAKLLEREPFGDADDSFFEEEEYGTVSALLGERTKPFLGIPSGPLQVGHFIGALGIVLMAFIEYPGFPLTNLPSELRGALQGGLATIYLINLGLAVVAVFRANARGQSGFIWAMKTFSIGGLALDQLSQLPKTTENQK